MHKRLFTILARLMVWWTGFACRCSGRVLLLATFMAGASLFYTSGHLGFNTNTNEMLSADLPFRQTYHVFEREFPQYLHNILIVIDGETPEDAREAARRMAAQLQSRPGLFKFTYLPLANRFLESHALLYLKKEKLETISDRLAAIQPFLGKLTGDPSLRGLFSMLESAVDAASDGEAVDIDPVLTRVTKALKASMEHRRYRLSWQELMRNNGKPSSQREQFILVQPRMDYGKLLAAKTAIQSIHEIARQLQRNLEQPVSIRLTGSVPLSHDELISVSRGAGTAVLFATIMVGIVLIVGLGSFRLVAATLICLFAGLSLTAAFAALTIGHLNLISIAFAVLYIGLGVDYAIHLCLRYRELKRKGLPYSSAVWQAVQDVGVSLLLCAMTTAVGFYCFIPTDYTGVSELGIISGTGMFISLIVTLALLPSILCLWPTKIHDRPGDVPASDSAAGWLHALGRWIERSGRPIRILALLLGLGAAWLLPQVRFDYNPINLRDQHSESVVTYKDLVARHTISPSSIMVLNRDERKVHGLEQRLKKLDAVDKVISIFDFIPKNQDEKLALIEDMSLILGPKTVETDRLPPPTPPEQIAALRKLDHSLKAYLHSNISAETKSFQQLHEMLTAFIHNLKVQVPGHRTATVAELQTSLLSTLPATLDFLHTALNTSSISKADLPPTLRQRWISDDGTYRIEVTPRKDIGDIHVLRHFVSRVRAIAPHATGAPIFTLEAGQAVIHAFQQAIATALVLVFTILLLFLRSLRDTVLVLLPLLLAGILTAAAGVLLHIPFNFANVIALPLLLGIGVDNGIHMVQRFHTLHRKQKTTRDLLGSSTSRAVILSALTTVCGFGNLSFSSHQGTASMGQLLSMGIIFTLLCTLFILPAFMQHVGWKLRL